MWMSPLVVLMLMGFVAVGLARGDVWPLMIGAALGLFLSITWLLAPYSKTAARLPLPDPSIVDRQHAVMERVRKVPIPGHIVRFGDWASGGAGERLAREYQEWLREEHRRKGSTGTDSDPGHD